MAQGSSLKVKDLEARLLKKDDTIAQFSTALSELTSTLKEREKENEVQLRCLREKMDSLESKVKSDFDHRQNVVWLHAFNFTVG